MKNLNAAFTLLLLASTLLSGQTPEIGPQELWPGRIPTQARYYYSMSVPAETYLWASQPPEGERWMPRRDKKIHRLVAAASTGMPKYQQLWRVAPDGQAQMAQYWSPMQPDTMAWTYRYNPAGVLTALILEGEEAYTYQYGPETAPLQELTRDLPLRFAPRALTDTILVTNQRNGGQHWLILDEGRRLAEYLAADKDGQLTSHMQYVYTETTDGTLPYCITTNQLSGRQWHTYASTASKVNLPPTTQLQTGIWYAAWGKSPLLYLHPAGRMLWKPNPTEAMTEGSWRREGSQLLLQLDNRRAVLGFEEENEADGGLQLRAVEDSAVLPLLSVPEPSLALRRRAEELALSHWEVYKSGRKVGLRYALDGRQLPAKYDAVEAVAESFAIVTLEGLQGVVRYDGQALTPIYYQQLSWMGEELLLAQKTERYTLIRPNGAPVTASGYDRILKDDGKGLRAVQNGRMGVIDKAGEAVVAFRFDSLSTVFGDKQRFAWSGEQMGVVGEDGKWVIEPGLYLQIMPAGKDRLLVQGLTGQWGILTSSGDLLAEPQYMHLRALGPMVFVAQLEGQFGLLDWQGQALTPIKYQLIKGCEAQAGQGLCEMLSDYNAVAQFISADGFGYLDAYGREHPPRLPTEKELASAYETVTVNEQLKFTFPKAKWQWEPSANRLYKQGDYGRVRVFYEQIELGGLEPEAWLKDNLPEDLYQRIQKQEMGGQPAWVVSEVKRIRYYDFRKKYAYVPLANGQLLRLEFSCKSANYLENAQDLYEIEQLLQVNP
ncbi:MAG TPA: hypothetical protein VJ933_08135 [Phaeodactylibacter sp.]|nr:hypothetical protein [Phaeodactylibacter sp.]